MRPSPRILQINAVLPLLPGLTQVRLPPHPPKGGPKSRLSTLVRHREVPVGSAIRTRPGTLDAAILDCLGADNEYRLPPVFEPDDVVLDIGMHIGGFGLEVLRRGAGRVHGFEAERSNFEIACENLKSFGPRADVRHQAIWRSDR